MQAPLSLQKLVQELPDNEGWRLIDVSGIVYTKNGYDLNLLFQRVARASELIQNEQFSELTRFKQIQGAPVNIKANVSFARIFTIGSIWWKNPENKPLLPDYFGSYRLTNNFLSVDPKKITLDQYIQATYIPKWRINKAVHYSSAPAIVYELESPLYHHKTAVGDIVLKDIGSLASTNFIIFHSYEIYRYCLSSCEIDDLNERALISSLYFNEKGENKLFNWAPINENTKFKPYEKPVYLLNSRDERNIEIIGNTFWKIEYRNLLRELQNSLKLQELNNFSVLSGLPISNVLDSHFTAKRVYRISDGAAGLLVFRIRSIKDDYSFSYKAMKPETNSNDGTNQGGVTVSKPQPTIDDGVGVDFDNTVTTFPHNPTIDLIVPDETMDLLNPVPSVLITSPGTYKVSDTTNSNIKDSTPGNNSVNPPGGNIGTNGGGLRPRPVLPPTCYFDLFVEICEKIKLKLEASGIQCTMQFCNDVPFFDRSAGYVTYQNLPFATDTFKSLKLKIYVVELEIKGNYLYLIEKFTVQDGIVRNAGRAWLYARPAYARIISEELKVLIEASLKKRVSNRDRLAPDLQLNHAHKDSDLVIQRDIAIEKNANKISKNIIEYLMKV